MDGADVDEQPSHPDRLEDTQDRRWGEYLNELKAKATLTPEEADTLKWLQSYYGETPSTGS